MNRIGRDLFAFVFFLLLHFFVVRDIAWISHEVMLNARRTPNVGRGLFRGSAL